MSYGGGKYKDFCDSSEQTRKSYFDKMIAAGMLPVVAAGNDKHNDATHAPSCISSAYTVAALTDHKDPYIASYSNYHKKIIDIAAPGTQIYSSVIQNLDKKTIKSYRIDLRQCKDFMNSRSLIWYEKGSIAIDIATLEEIAIALEVHPSQLLMSSAPEQSTPQAQGLVDETYMFSYDGREKRIITSVIERYATEESNRFSIRLFYDVPSRNQLSDCVALYQGFSTKHDVLDNYTLESSYPQIEQIWLSCISGLSLNMMQKGFLAGLLNYSLLPAVRKVILNPHLIPEDELMEHLVFTKKDLQTIRKSNLFIIDEFIA